MRGCEKDGEDREMDREVRRSAELEGWELNSLNTLNKTLLQLSRTQPLPYTVLTRTLDGQGKLDIASDRKSNNVRQAD